MNLVIINLRTEMKKNILKVAFVAAIALVSGINVFNAHKTETLSDVALANVEALAEKEWDEQTCFWVDSDYMFCLPWGTGVACICYQ